MLIIRYLLLSALLFGSPLNFIYANNFQMQECYEEILPHFAIDPIPEQIVGKTFTVTAHLPSSAIFSLPDIKDTSSVIVSVRLYGYGFDVNDSSPVMQDISKENGTWQWEVTAKNAGKQQEISFEVMLQNGYPILNCLPKRFITVMNIPLGEIIWNDICKQWITIVLSMCSLTISIISICLASKK